VAGEALTLNNKAIIDFAACLYRLVLTGFLDLEFNQPMPPSDDEGATSKFISRRMEFRKPQRLLEAALLTAIS
jgi:hypothetical protein